MKIGLFGSTGHMGQTLQNLAKGETLFAIPRNATSLENVDVAIDFSSHLATSSHLQLCEKHHIPLVIGTTGHSQEELSLIEKSAQKIPIFKASNFSLGIHLMKKMLSLLKKGCSHVNIVERHPKRKKDAPSGTALELSSIFPESQIHSIRSHDYGFMHECSCFLEEEEIIVTHNAFNRYPFALGALKAAKFLVKMPKGLYNMDDLMKGD